MTEEKQIKEVVFTISKGSWDDVLMVQVELDPSIVRENSEEVLDDLHKRITDFISEWSNRNIPVIFTVEGIKTKLLGVESEDGKSKQEE